MVIHVCGRLGSGKTMWAVAKILETLIFTNKIIISNIRLVDFWDKVFADDKIHGIMTFIRFFLSPMPTIADYKVMLAERIAHRYFFFAALSDAMDYAGTLPVSDESSRLLIWDEIHLDLNARQWKTTSHDMIGFFSMSRKRGFDIIMVSQLRSAVDRQMRDLADISYELKNLAHFKPFGFRIFPHIGLLVKRWQNKGGENNKSVFVGAGLVRYSNRVGKYYDTMQILTDKGLQKPLIWCDSISKSSCCKCCYMRYYLKYYDFIKYYYPGRDYNGEKGLRIIDKEVIPGIEIKTNG